MRLFSRLLISHLAPSMVLTIALGLILFALVRLTVMLGQLNDQELGALGTDGKLHSAAWELDVAMRHGFQACTNDAEEASSRVGAAMVATTDHLRAELAARPGASAGIRKLSARYVQLGERVVEEGACAALVRSEVQGERAQLDEELTNHWVDRLSELSEGLQRKDDEARSLGKIASFGGITLAAVAFAASLWLAHRLARDVGGPLGQLSALARRVGRGDLRGRVEVEGPAEVVTLAEELEGMRERLLQLESLKQGFLASVSHELRTPLSKIRESLALLSDGAVGPLSERQARVVEIARVACEREIRMVTTLLDVSRLRAGAPLRFSSGTSLDELVRNAVRDEGADAAARDVQVELTMSGEAPAMTLDGELLERAIANLVRNAVGVSKAKQKVRVQRDLLDGGPHDRKGRWARLSVRDQGPGVPDDLREAIFDAFVTRAVPKSPKAIGVGLGLALAREVAEAHGGELSLGENGPGGACFVMWIPFDKAAPSRMAAAAPLATLSLIS
ncbi:MAG: HAMP domain-containing sensor histidine kinase [Polyangiaceae bacterium]